MRDDTEIAVARKSAVSRDEFDQIVRDIKALPSASREEHADAFEQIDAVIQAKQGRSTVSVSDVRDLARLRIQVIPPEQLKYHAQQIVDTIKEIAPNRRSSLLSTIDTIDQVSEDEKRAYAIALQDLRVQLSISAEYGAIRRFQLLSDIAAAWAITLLILVAVFIGFSGVGTYAVAAVALVAIWGSLGAVISLTARVRDLNIDDLARDAQRFQARDWSLMLGPVFGGVGSVLVVAAVTAGLVTSELVSKEQLQLFWQAPTNVKATLQGWSAANLTVICEKLFAASPSTILLYFIALVAGRSERVVVDTLDLVERRITQK